MNLGTLYGIGVGPGDPDLLTVKAAALLGRCRHVFAPRSAPGTKSVALSIASRHLSPRACVEEIEFPMVSHRPTLEERWNQAASRVCDVLDQGEDACFLTLGDPLLYSTFIYLLRAVRARRPDVSAETVPGVMAFNAAAALADFPIGEAKRQVRIVPTADDLEEVEGALRSGGTVVLMKIGKRLGKILDVLERTGTIDRAVLVSRAGLPGQRIEKDLSVLRDENGKAGYLSVILVDAEKEVAS